MFDKLEGVERRYNAIEAEMARPEVAADYERLQSLAKERAGLERLVELYRRYRRLDASLQEAQAILSDGADEELESLAQEEVISLETQQAELGQQLRLALLPQDPNDEKDVIVEIRAGTGGEEAALFAADLFRLYTRYAQRQGWRAELLSSNETGIGGFKEVVLAIHGESAYSRLKHESGVHRVQRVPVTEASGRVHTSTATVAVLPEADEVDVAISPEDLRIDVFHSGGPGGQNVNKVATAIRLTHIPTGEVVVCQDERSQLKNRTKAMAILRARLFDQELRRQQEEIGETRRSQVGTAERSEKIRTYNYPQNRVSDHRINLNLHSLDRVLDGDIDSLIDALIQAEQERLLARQVA